MKKNIKILLLILCALLLVACESKEEEKDNKKSNTETKEQEQKPKQEDKGGVKVLKEDKKGEITEGVIENYHFKETEKVTNHVKIQMEDGGVILIVLSNSQAPITIKNFQNLVKEKFYDGIIFHRVISNFMIQGGDPTGTGASGSGKTIKGEFAINGVENNLSHVRGTVSMARKGAKYETEEQWNSASSQFFIVVQDSTFLDGNYASFGKVFAGMDTVDRIRYATTDSNDRPIEDQKMKSIRFIELIED